MATKSTGKSRSTRTTEKTTAVSSQPSNSNRLDQLKRVKNNKVILIIIIVVVLLFIFLYFFKGLFVASVVNGQPITRLSVVRALEKQGGKETLDSLVTKTLITQEAKKKNITVSQQDIDGELQKISKNLETQDTTLDKALATQGMTKNQLINDIKIQLYIQKMLENKVSVTDKEINEFITANKSQFPQGTTDKDMRDQASASLKQQKMQTETQNLIKSLQDNAKIINFVQY